jgi:hypothetical protein
MLEVDDANTSMLMALRKKIARHGANRDAPTSAALGKEGTRLAGGLRLLAFCSKHRECANIRGPSAAKVLSTAVEVPGAQIVCWRALEMYVMQNSTQYACYAWQHHSREILISHY